MDKRRVIDRKSLQVIGWVCGRGIESPRLPNGKLRGKSEKCHICLRIQTNNGEIEGNCVEGEGKGGRYPKEAKGGKGGCPSSTVHLGGGCRIYQGRKGGGCGVESSFLGVVLAESVLMPGGKEEGGGAVGRGQDSAGQLPQAFSCQRTATSSSSSSSSSSASQWCLQLTDCHCVWRVDTWAGGAVEGGRKKK